jgi:hypothetical protein
VNILTFSSEQLPIGALLKKHGEHLISASAAIGGGIGTSFIFNLLS